MCSLYTVNMFTLELLLNIIVFALLVFNISVVSQENELTVKHIAELEMIRKSSEVAILYYCYHILCYHFWLFAISVVRTDLQFTNSACVALVSYRCHRESQPGHVVCLPAHGPSRYVETVTCSVSSRAESL